MAAYQKSFGRFASFFYFEKIDFDFLLRSKKKRFDLFTQAFILFMYSSTKNKQ